jgi:AcrR family transcriptional regulator
MKRRAEQQRETRERIVDAAMALHEELGPAETTISGLAERAGVQRLTVYRHFADEQELLSACTSKWLSLHPPPDLSKLESEGPERTRDLLRGLYSYYRETEKMWTAAYRDLEKVPAMAEPMSGFEDYLAAASRQLAASWAPRNRKRLRATVRHAVRFSTWRSLARQRLADTAMAELVCAWIAAAAA